MINYRASTERGAICKHYVVAGTVATYIAFATRFVRRSVVQQLLAAHLEFCRERIKGGEMEILLTLRGRSLQ